ncbi:hypothetical protein TWF481_011768 [Arthrobotrys musiformis]|uniref:Uncharacterized protein n=1 Tax=Arthrobotrys musiformis TaxID=47236 RepID=A0AAV9VW55_9PEZI
MNSYEMHMCIGASGSSNPRLIDQSVGQITQLMVADGSIVVIGKRPGPGQGLVIRQYKASGGRWDKADTFAHLRSSTAWPEFRKLRKSRAAALKAM